MAQTPLTTSTASHTHPNNPPDLPSTTRPPPHHHHHHHQQPPTPLPSAHNFDLLPALHELLARLDHRSTDPTTTVLTPDAADPPRDPLGVGYAGLQPLDPKDLPTAILPLKALMRRGLKEVEALPDVERSVREQEEEVRELEERIRRLRGTRRELAEGASRVREGLDGG